MSNARIEEAVRLGCLLECTAAKPGNVHPKAAFDDLCYDDFVRSAEVVTPIIADCKNAGVGQTVLNAIQATREAVGKNTNLGIVLLLAPLAAVPLEVSLRDGIAGVLSGLTVEDAELVYQAIRLCAPGGMGKVEQEDVADSPTGTLLEMMRLASERDAVAAQYADGFELVLGEGHSRLLDSRDWFPDRWEPAVVRLHLHLMGIQPDTLIARKCGWESAKESQRRAVEVLAAGWPETPRGRELFVEFDDWLRADGNRRNPGTTADLVAATLFAALRENLIAAPVSV